ncbi:MAG: cytochrome c3 family protein [Planctomycetota bacterium]
MMPVHAVPVLCGAVMVLCFAVLVAAAEDPKPAQPAETPKPAQSAESAQQQKDWGKVYVAGRPKAEEIEAQEKQAAEAAKRAMDAAKMDCKQCHSCDSPTKENLCLQMCPRSVAEAIADAAHEQLPPDVILLHAFGWEERRFMPVPFNHKVHSNMAGMAGGCDVCHHRSSPGRLHPPCRGCHKAAYAKQSEEEMRMPSLKGAYHRQCMGCHRNWSHSTKCSICHLPKGDQREPVADVQEFLSPSDPAIHPPIENPEYIVKKTEYEAGPVTMFRHREHVDVYGYDCERCHRGANCASCHERARKPKETLATVKEQTHDACFACHAEDRCERCHSKEGEVKPQRFDHSVTGFPLEKYHGQLTCRACHKRLFFLRRLESDCGSCHKDWKTDTFNHAVTGQALDENHRSIDCKDCHTDGRFISPPSCKECHEDDEGIEFPKKRPGPMVTPAAPNAMVPAKAPEATAPQGTPQPLPQKPPDTAAPHGAP